MTSTDNLLVRSLVTGIAAGAVLAACFMLGLAVLEVLSANALEPQIVPIAVGAAAVVGAVAGAAVGLVAGLCARAPLARGNVTAARAIIGSVAAIGAGATVYLVYGPLGSGEQGTWLGVAVAVVGLGAAVAGWFLTSVLLRSQD